ncbi:MAG: zinc-ribbon domain-containing protein [Methanobrevibacter sp.]|nr:zinc ribbon domain-containing protein [Methanobrevibacter sp.]MBE6490494.1 zinc-ribbon domain-containing protein [Methanobrevibacter sp.]
MGNFCIYCGAKLENDYKFCINCGAKVDVFGQNQDNSSFKSSPGEYEKDKARDELKRLAGGKILLDAFFIEDLNSNGLDYAVGLSIRQQIEKEIDLGQVKSGDVEARIDQLMREHRTEKEKKIAEENAQIAKQKEKRSKKIETPRPAHGGYCSFNCAHYREEYLDSGGGIVGDMDFDGYVEYYCSLGHQIADGKYCTDYE